MIIAASFTEYHSRSFGCSIAASNRSSNAASRASIDSSEPFPRSTEKDSAINSSIDRQCAFSRIARSFSEFSTSRLACFPSTAHDFQWLPFHSFLRTIQERSASASQTRQSFATVHTHILGWIPKSSRTPLSSTLYTSKVPRYEVSH